MGLSFDLDFAVDKKVYRALGAIGSNEVLALQGPSGCGKTTFLRTIMGFHEGELRKLILDGVDLRALKVGERQFSACFQGGGLLEQLSAYENILLPLLHGYAAKKRSESKEELGKKVLLEMSRLGLADCRRRVPAELSGGEKQRVSLLRALLLRPKALFLDEPSTGIDESRKRAVLDWTKERLKEWPCPCILVTHDSSVVEALADRKVLWPEESEVIDFGS